MALLSLLLGGGRRFESDEDVAQAVLHRLDPAAVENLQKTTLTAKETAALIIPTRTLSHRRARGEPLTLEESDKLARVARIVALAAEVFGDADAGLAWLRKPLVRFGDRAPMAMIATEAGARLVEELLIQIDEGYFA